MSIPFIPFPVPEEMRARMEEQHNRTMMEAQDTRHQIAALFNEISKEHLLALRILLSGIAQCDSKAEAKQFTAYYEGIAASKLEHRFNVCPGCGEDHDQEIFGSEKVGEATGEPREGIEVPADGVLREHKLLGGGKVQPSLFTEACPTCHGVNGIHVPVNGLPCPIAVTDVQELMPEDLKRMEEYNLDDLRDQDTLKLIGFICNGCGMTYQSIEDRMLRPPGVEGCSGCQQKAAFG